MIRPAAATLRRATPILLLVVLLFGRGPRSAAEELDYRLTGPELRLVRLDSSPTESFLSVRADAAGRLFVGGREALFVYEPDDAGGYRPRRELYRFPKDTWVYDVEVRGNDLYVLTTSALYLLPEAVTRRGGLRPKRLIWGVPRGSVHQCFHGLAWGPEGDLYLSMGDPTPSYGDFNRPDHWAHWTWFSQPDGTRTPYTGVGGVFRCRPDGSGFQVVARGTRNSVGLAFDRSWNLFTNDNDHESIPADYVPGRLLHVTPHAYFSWPRGWLPSRTPDRADLLETMFDGMGRAVPVGQAYYGDTFLPEKYRDNLLLARWGIRALTCYPLEHRGASFKATEHILLAGRNQARPVGVTVGRDGRIFVTIFYMAHNEASPVCKSDLVMITRADDPPAHPFRPYDITAATPAKLWTELADPSWERRQRAHVEILRRGAPLLTTAARLLQDARPDEPAYTHLLWLAGAAGTEQGRAPARRALGSRDPQARLQAVRVLDEFFPAWQSRREVLTRTLADPDPQVRHAAVVALFKDASEPPAEVVTGPARSQDTYLRQAATLLLAENTSVDRLAELCRAGDRATRLAGVLAAGFRLTLPPAARPLPPDAPLAPFASQDVYVIPFADTTLDLRRHGRLGYFTMAELWKACKHTAEQERLFALLRGMLDDGDEPVRLQAAHFLFLLDDSRSEPAVAKVRRASEERRLAVAPLHGIGKVWLVGPFPDGDRGLATVHPPERGPIDLSAQYDAGGKKLTWKELASGGSYFDLSKAYGPCEHASFYAYCRLESAARQRALLLVGSDDGVQVYHNGREVWTNPVVRGALPFQDVVVLDLQPGGNDVLVRAQNVTGDCGLYLHYRALGPVVARLPEKLGSAALAERLKGAVAGGQAPVGEEFLKVDWEEAVRKGDAARGRQLFGSLGCVKCHGITPDTGVVGGPSLAEAHKRFTVPYVVESVLLPSKQVSPVFRASYVATTRGQVFTGLVVSETADRLELLLPDTTRKTLAQADVAERKLLDTSPMPQGLVKTPAELRDLLAYLFSDDPKAP
jgi:putative heme-binding domain-containing protein